MARKIDIGSARFTEVYATDDIEHNANHEYTVTAVNSTVNYAEIKFQKGPIREHGVNGCHNEDLIAIVIDRLEHLNQGQFACRENSIAITKLTEALLWLNKRTNDRIKRGVEGTHQV